MAPDTDFDPDGLFNRNVFVKVAMVPVSGYEYQSVP